MFRGVKECCSPDGHCKTKNPASPQNAGRDCNQIAFDHQKTFDFHIDLPTVAIIRISLPARTVEALERWHFTAAVEPSPPDLQVLYSTFLI